MYADWIYVWCLTYYLNVQLDMFIMLKKSLKWVPLLGWGMQIFEFLFVARSWAEDRIYLERKLGSMAKRAEMEDNPLALLIFPEGTLVSKDTRPLSKKYADKIGIPDMTHTLLPRSTGMQYALRALSPRIPSLHLLDITIAYPGIPRLGYGQSYYTLRSILFSGVPPPRIHMHLKLYNVKHDIPMGTISIDEQGNELEATDLDKSRFAEWIRQVWRDKDERFERFYETGSFASETSHVNGETQIAASSSAQEVEVPLRLRSSWEILDAFALPGPLAWQVFSGSR